MDFFPAVFCSLWLEQSSHSSFNTSTNAVLLKVRFSNLCTNKNQPMLATKPANLIVFCRTAPVPEQTDSKAALLLSGV